MSKQGLHTGSAGVQTLFRRISPLLGLEATLR